MSTVTDLTARANALIVLANNNIRELDRLIANPKAATSKHKVVPLTQPPGYFIFDFDIVKNPSTGGSNSGYFIIDYDVMPCEGSTTVNKFSYIIGSDGRVNEGFCTNNIGVERHRAGNYSDGRYIDATKVHGGIYPFFPNKVAVNVTNVGGTLKGSTHLAGMGPLSLNKEVILKNFTAIQCTITLAT